MSADLDPALDPESDRSLADQLAALLRSEISAGERLQGSQLPSEREFERDYGISRTVVRDALNDLVLEGIVVKRKGHGTFVRVQPHVRRITLVGPDVLTARMPTPDERRRLKLDPGVPVIQVAGKMYASDQYEFVVGGAEDAEDRQAFALHEAEKAAGTLRTVPHAEARDRLGLKP